MTIVHFYREYSLANHFTHEINADISTKFAGIWYSLQIDYLPICYFKLLTFIHMLFLSLSLCPKSIPIISQNRFLEKQGELQDLAKGGTLFHIRSKLTPIFLFLFNDILILASKKRSVFTFPYLDLDIKFCCEFQPLFSSPPALKSMWWLTMHTARWSRWRSSMGLLQVQALTTASAWSCWKTTRVASASVFWKRQPSE